MATASILCRDSWQCSTRFCSSSHRMARRAQDFKSCHRLSQENGSQRCACVCLNLLLKINNYWNWGHPSTLRIYIYIIYTVYIHISNITPYITIQTYLRKVLVCWCDIDMFGFIFVSACDSFHTELGLAQKWHSFADFYVVDYLYSRVMKFPLRKSPETYPRIYGCNGHVAFRFEELVGRAARTGDCRRHFVPGARGPPDHGERFKNLQISP